MRNLIITLALIIASFNISATTTGKTPAEKYEYVTSKIVSAYKREIKLIDSSHTALSKKALKQSIYEAYQNTLTGYYIKFTEVNENTKVNLVLLR